jgi:hypothetical protein
LDVTEKYATEVAVVAEDAGIEIPAIASKANNLR